MQAMASLSTPRLRNTLRKLRASIAEPVAPEDAEAMAQDLLDFLAVQAGIKPVQMLAQDHGGAYWNAAIVDMAERYGFAIIEGPQWRVGSYDQFPDWLREHVHDTLSNTRHRYVCRDRRTAREVSELCGSGVAAVEQEARLLNYPRCCVERHHERSVQYFEVFLANLRRHAQNDEAAARLLAEGYTISDLTPDEAKAVRELVAGAPAPFTSFQACEGCMAAGSGSPAQFKVREALQLARAVDEQLLETLCPAGWLDEVRRRR